MTYLPRYLAIDAPLNPPGPNAGRVCFSFDAKWLPYILGSLQGLTLEIAWKSNQQQASGEASLLLAEFLSAGLCAVPETGGIEMEDCMGCCIRVQDGKIQVFSCGEWQDVPGGDIKAIVNGTSQPAAGTPQPAAGECMGFSGSVAWGGRWLLPVPVNAGDKIKVTQCRGATTDYALTQLLWRCGDGTIFIGDVCVSGSEILDSLAPAPTFPQQALIGFDGANYYNFADAASSIPVEITIPSGIVNANFVFLINDEVTFGAGDLSFDMSICKASENVERFSHTFDLRAGLGGMVIRTAGAVAPFAAFSPGVGVTIHNPSAVSGQGLLEVGIHCPRTLHNVVVRLVATTTPPSYNEHGIYNMQGPDIFTSTILETFADATNPNLNMSAAFAGACDYLKVNANADHAGDDSTITQIVVAADGSDPF